MAVVTVETAKLNARVDGTSEDELFPGWIATAETWIENYTGHLLSQRTVTEHFDGFGCLRLRSWPIAPDAPVLIAYTDGSGFSQTLSGYRLDVGDRPALLTPSFGSSWPSAAGGKRTVSATFVAGYAAPGDVPAEMVTAVLMMVKSLSDDREITDQVDLAASRLCRPYRLLRV